MSAEQTRKALNQLDKDIVAIEKKSVDLGDTTEELEETTHA